VSGPVPPKLEALILCCLAKEPEGRPDDDELLAALRECERESPWEVLQRFRALEEESCPNTISMR
jgi:hypothetical protein